MKITSLIPALAGATILSASALAVDNAANSGDKILREMSTKLAGAGQFSLEATREIDAAIVGGSEVPEKAHIKVEVARPNRIAARSVSKERTMHFISNGQTLTIFNETKNHYAQAAMRTSIDGLVDRLDKEYGFVPALADFAVSNPYKEIRQQSHSVTYVGREKLPGGFLGLGRVACDHVALKGREADAELWIAADDRLPRKLVATFHRPGRPQLRITFSDWNLAAAIPASHFQFAPPKDAQKIEMWTTAKMQSAQHHSKKQ